jgi:O-antigen ligase
VTQAVQREEPEASSTMLSFIVLAGVLAGLIGILKFAFMHAPRASSTTAGTYTLGAYLCVVLPLVILAPASPVNRRRELWNWFAALVFSVGIAFTYDRLHWVGMAGVLLVTGMISRKRILLFVVAAGVLVWALSPSLQFRLEQMADIGAFMTGRDVLWRGATMLVGKHPLVGFGPRTFTSIFPLFDQMPIRGVASWHNDYLQVYMESGVMGLAPLLWLVVATFRHGRRALRSSALPEEHRRLIVPLLVSLGVIFVIGGVLDTLVGILFRILLGLFAVLASTPPAPSGMTSAPLTNRPLSAPTKSMSGQA